MSNDLISRKQLLDSLRGNVLIDVTPALETEINAQPTAYDVDRVVDQLAAWGNRQFEIANKAAEARNDEAYKGIIKELKGIVEACIENAIEIVKGGGVDG